MTAAAEAFQYKFPAGTLVFARPKAKAYLGFDFEQGGFDNGMVKLSYELSTSCRRPTACTPGWLWPRPRRVTSPSTPTSPMPRPALRCPAVRWGAARGGRALGAGQNDGVSAKLGLIEDLTLRAYFDAGGADNLANMIRLVVQREFKLDVVVAPPRELPQVAMWEPHSGKLFERFDDYAASYLARRGGGTGAGAASRPWVGLVINRGQALETRNEAVQAIVAALEQRGFNVLAAFGFPSPLPVERLLLDASGQPRVAAVVAMGMKLGNAPDKIVPALQRLGVPLVNAITLYRATRQEWEESPIGLDLTERSWQIAGPEFAGIVAPTVVRRGPIKEPRR